MTRRTDRRLLVALLALTVVIAVLDLARGPGVSSLRAGGAAVLGPLERAVHGGGGDLAEVAAERDRYAAQAQASAADRATATRLDALLGSPGARGARVVTARVVAVGAQGTAGPERVTIDAGSRDGLSTDLSVITADGLVGRTVSVGPWTTDVLVLGAADLTVGVRVGSPGTLGAVSAAATTAARPRPAGQLSLALVQRGVVAAGDRLITLGSEGDRPFPPGIPVGTVTAVDPARGQLAPTAAVRPAADPTTLDVVAVLLTRPRAVPRPVVTGGSS